MRIEIYTKTGESLIRQIFSAIENEDVKTWVIKKNKDGDKFLTHKPEQWCDKALFGLKATDDKVTISLHWWEKIGEPADDIKGYYIGRFTELLLVNFKEKFTKFEIVK
jgi:hypothetical protein